MVADPGSYSYRHSSAWAYAIIGDGGVLDPASPMNLSATGTARSPPEMGMAQADTSKPVQRRA